MLTRPCNSKKKTKSIISLPFSSDILATKQKMMEIEKSNRIIQRKKKWWTKLKPYSFSEESAGDDEGGVDGGPAHDHLVKPFEKASAAASSSRWIHGDCDCLLYASLFLAPDLVR
jgi:hypothetical protein